MRSCIDVDGGFFVAQLLSHVLGCCFFFFVEFRSGLWPLLSLPKAHIRHQYQQ